MKPEDVPDAWIWAAEEAQAKVPLGPGCEWRLLLAAIAAVAPLIAAAERERCARAALGVPISAHTYGTDLDMAVNIATAIRALD